MNGKKDFKTLVKRNVGRPRIGKEPRRSKSYSLDEELIKWIDSNGSSDFINRVLSEAKIKHEFDRRG